MKKSTKSMLPTLAAPVSRTTSVTAKNSSAAQGVTAGSQGQFYLPFAGDSDE